MAENRDAMEVFQVVHGQFMVDMSGNILDLDINAIKIVMDLYRVRAQKDCLGKVQRLFHLYKEEIEMTREMSQS
jgi:hypothetical protein